MKGFAAGLVLAAAAWTQSLAAVPIVNTKTGPVSGISFFNNKTNGYLGVPFAAPPVGDLRWKPPQPAAEWSGIRDGSKFGDACPQSGAFSFGVKTSEDCLYLNVFTPASPKTAGPLPVMMFMYGGSWKYGAASFPLYWGEYDEEDVQDVIIVTINYRLSIFGYLASSSLRAEDPDHTTGNYGIQDQRLAMTWIQDNIAAFGGDTSRVTIMGESAGAGSVSNHLVMPRSKGLFHRAIAESGPWAAWTAQSFNESEYKFKLFAEHSGCASLGNVTTNPDILTCLRAFNTSQLMGFSNGLPHALLEWSPVVDGVELSDYPENLAKRGEIVNPVPFLLGTNHDEGTLFNNAPHDLNATGYLPYIEKEFSSLGPAIAKEYPPSDYQSPWWALTYAFGDGAMSCPARRSARWMTNVSNSTYLYWYTHVLEVVADFTEYYGCFHGSELVMVFDFKLLQWTDAERALGLQFVRYWTRFAATGNPNGGTDPVWPAYSNATDTLMQLRTPEPVAVAGVKKDLCDWWDQQNFPESAVFGPIDSATNVLAELVAKLEK